jgi:acyl-CoA thioesterase II
LIAQSLAAAQFTIPSTSAIHSMHCYFINKGESKGVVSYSVEATRCGRGFHTRIVHARQNGRVIFTTMASFTKAEPDTFCIRHSTPVMGRLPPTPDAKALGTSSLSQVDEAMECVLAPSINGRHTGTLKVA